jgi:hypothetical protein
MQTKKKNEEIYNADDVIGGKNSWVEGQDSVIFCQNLFLFVFKLTA